jgi:hypothetical protein
MVCKICRQERDNFFECVAANYWSVVSSVIGAGLDLGSLLGFFGG